jgi:hypothetical protein
LPLTTLLLSPAWSIDLSLRRLWLDFPDRLPRNPTETPEEESMADPYWHNFVKSLDDYQRNQLSQALLDFHTQRDHSLGTLSVVQSL